MIYSSIMGLNSLRGATRSSSTKRGEEERLALSLHMILFSRTFKDAALFFLSFSFFLVIVVI